LQTRTLLTTPPGHAPVDEALDQATERYSHGLALPREPRIPSRLRGVAGLTATVGLIAMFAWGAFRIISDAQTFDPALDRSVPTDSIPGEPVDESP